MTFYPLGAWEPDSTAVNVVDAQGKILLQEARNVLPSKTGYGPIKRLVQISVSVLPEAAAGMCVARTSSGGYLVFAGSRTKLYRYNTGTAAWDDYTRTVGGDYNVSTDDYWSFTQFGSTLIAVNLNDDAQAIDVDSGATAFSALSGSPPRARYVTTVGDFVILACLSSNNRKVRNSAINDATGWTIGTSLCDEQEFADGGRVTGVAGGEFGWVVQEKSIRRMDFHAGSDIAFTFERVEKERGAAAGYSVVSTINAVFFLSDDGFYSFGANGLNPIGAQRINDWYRANSDQARFFSTIAFSDPYGPRVCWAFPNATGSTTFDRLLIYDWQLDRWSYSHADAQFWATSATAGTTLEALDAPYPDLDVDVPYSLDSRVWEGGRPVIGAVDITGQLAFLEGALPFDALLTTAPMQLVASKRANVASVTPVGIFNGATLGIRVGARERTQDAVSYSASITPSTTSGIARSKRSGRYHQIETTITQTAGQLWTHMQAVDVAATSDGGK